MRRKYAQNKRLTSTLVVLLCCTILSTILLASLSGVSTINILITASLLATVGLGIIVFKHKIWLSPELSLFLLWTAFSLIPTLTAYHVEAALWKTFTLVQIALMVFAVQQTVIWSKQYKIFAQCFALGIAVSYFISYSSTTAYELAQMDVTGEHGSDESRIASTLADANMFGVSACLALSLVLMACRNLSSRIERIAMGLLVIVLIIGVLHSGSRTAFMGLVVILFGAIVTFRLYKPSRIAGAGVSLLSVGALAVVAVLFLSQLDTFKDKFEAIFIDNDGVVARMEGFTAVLSGDSALDSADGSIAGRSQMMVAGINLVKDNPIVGIGLGNFGYVTEADTYAHSTPIELLVSTGIAGAMLYYGIYAMLFYRLLKLSKRSSLREPMLSGMFGLIAYMLMDVTHVSFSEKTSWLFLAIVSASVEVHRRSLLRSKKQKVRRKKRRKKENQLQGGMHG